MRRFSLTLLLFSCATTSVLLQRDAASCESFSEFDQRVREQLDGLLKDAPGDALVRESSRLNAARRTCARHAISKLLTLREERGVEAVQRELDALSATYRHDELKALMTQTLGEDLTPLEPLLVEARVKVNRQSAAPNAERRDEAEREKLVPEIPASLGAAPDMPDSMCDERSPCEQLRCLVEHPPASPEVAARGCLDEVTALEPNARARRAAEVLSLLPSPPSPARTEARMMLETLRTQLWPQVEAAVAAKQPGRAAQLAGLFRTLPSVATEVERLRDEAQAHHLARAKASSSPEEVWLHLRLAADFGGPAALPLTAKGQWQAPRWRCPEPVPAFPELPAGLGATLTLRCNSTKPEEKPKKKDESPMRTFELESSLRGQRLEASLRVTCADRSLDYTLTVEDPGVSGFPQEVLREALERTIAKAAQACVPIHELAATRSCTELRKRTPAALIARFVDHAHFLQRWELCFEEWLLATEGVSPPLLPSDEVQQRDGRFLKKRQRALALN